MLVAHGVAHANLGVEITPLGVEHVEVVDAAGPVLQLRQVDILAGRIAQVGLQRRRTADAAVGHHGVVDLLEDLEHLLLVAQPRLVVGRHGGAVARLLAPEGEERCRERPGHVGEGRLEEVVEVSVLNAAREGQHQPREAVGVGHAHGRHRRTQPLLRRTHVGTPLEQLRGEPHGNRVGEHHLGIHAAAHHLPVGVFAHEQRDAVLCDFDAPLQVGDERRRRGVLHLGLLEDRLGGQPPLEAQPRLLDPLAAGLERLPHDGQLVVERHQIEVGRGHLGHQRHAHRTLVLDRGHVFGTPLALGPAQVAPHVELPAHRGLHTDFGVVDEVLAVVVVRLAVGIDRGTERGQPLGLLHAVELAVLLDTGRGGQHVLVVLERPFDDAAQGRVAVELPPGQVGHRERVGIPLGKGRGEVQLGAPAFAHRRAGGGGEGRQKQKQSKYRTMFHFFSLAFNRYIQTKKKGT